MTVDLAPARVISEPPTYHPESTRSFFADLARAEAFRDPSALERLDRHHRETAALRAAEAAAGESTRAALAPMGAEFRAVNGTAGTGGEFNPPAWLIPLFGAGAVAGRVLADVIGQLGGALPLPLGTSNINIPRFSAGGQVAIQTAQGNAVLSVDETSYDAQSQVATIAGMEQVSQQILDQTPGGYDQIVSVDLGKNYNRALDQQLFYGTGTNGQLLGLANVPAGGTTSTTPTSVSGASATTFTAMWPLLGQVAAGVGNNRGMPAQHIFMSPRRWAWIASSLDSSNRPIASPDMAPLQASGWALAGNTRLVGSALGKPVWESGALNGASPSVADSIFMCRPEEMLLFESQPRFLVNVNSQSGILQVTLRLHRYVAFIPHRYPAGIGVLANLPAPTGF